MQVSVETTSGLERQMTVTIPAERIENDVESRLKQTALTARIDGFRPGKVPLKVIKRRYGKGVRQDVLGDVIQHTFYEAVTQEKLKPAGGPNIEPKDDKEGEDFQYVATFEVYPEISLGDFSVAEIEKQVATVSDADVDDMIETLRSQHTEWSPADADKSAESGDQLSINFEGFKDGEAFEGGKAEGHDLILGSNTLIPGFESGLTGAKAGDETELNLSFPDSYQAEHLAGQDVMFKVKVNSVSIPVLPELKTAFFEQFGIKDKDLDGFKTEIRNNMEREVTQAISGKLKTQVMNKLVDINQIDIPKALTDGEVDRLRQQAVQQFGGGVDMDASALPAELFSEQAKHRVAVGLLVGEVIRSKELKSDSDRVRAKIEEMAMTYQEPQQVIDYYYGNKEQLAQVESLVLEDQVLDLLLGEAKVTEVVVPYAEAIKPAEPKAKDAEASEATEVKDEAAVTEA
jgi:trigger factor